MRRAIDLSGYIAFAVALLATVGSLAMSEAFGLIPCVLCWYQRIFMYPLVIIIGVAVLRRDTTWPITAIPFAVLGVAVSLYHSLLQWQVLPESAAPCVAGVSCITLHVNWLGFITIPFMSLLAFLLIIGLALIRLKGEKYDQRS
jgi:disulfide bond formation protein DsbB